jgi:putative ABC transport system substrate-binding protein
MRVTRRAFLGAAAGAFACGPSPVRAQAHKVYKIGYLSTGSIAGSYQRPIDVFRSELRDLGWIEGRTVAIEYRWADGQYDRLPDLAQELVALNVDVIAASPTPAVLAARAATRTIPIVGMGLVEPVAFGLVTSIARPGGNVTGVTYSVGAEIYGKQLQLLSDVASNVRKVAVLVNPDGGPAVPVTIDHIRTAARTLGIDVMVVEARAPEHFDGAFVAMKRDRAGAVLVSGDPMFLLQRARLAALALQHRLPSMSTQAQWVEAGGLVSYGPNLPELWRRGAHYVDKILRGAKAADMPIEHPTTFELVLNLRTARALGLEVPGRVLQRADQVIQ